MKFQADEIMKRKNVSEVFATSDGVFFLTLESANRHARKNKLMVEKFVKSKKTRK